MPTPENTWQTFPRATRAQIAAAEDTWTERVEQVGIVVVVDEEGREVDVLAANWWLCQGLAVIAPMPVLRAAVERGFPAAWEAEQRIRDERFAQWTGGPV
jgi:hypothetical protein